MKLHGLAHIGVPCVNLEKSICFYQQLGFSVITRKDSLNGYHVAMVKNADCIIELYESLQNDKNGAGSWRKEGCIDHIALKCRDSLDECYHWAVKNGYSIVSDGIETTMIWDTPCRYFLLSGPDKERIEISEH